MSNEQSVEEGELELFRDSIRRILNDLVAPHYDDWEKAGITPREVWNKLGDAGLLCVDMPEEYGGYGAPFEFSVAVCEEMSRLGFASLAGSVAVHSDIVAPYLLRIGTEEQKKRWLPALIKGEIVGAIGMTEPNTGSDLQAIRTTALREGDHYRVNGSKIFISNGQHAGLLILAAKTDPQAGGRGTSLLLVDTTLPGFERGRNLEKMGQHSADTSELFFNDLMLPKDALLGVEGEGFLYLVANLPRERLLIATNALVASEAALEWTIEYVLQRKAFGQSLASFQNTRFKLAEMKTKLVVHRAFVERCMADFAEDKLDATTAAMAKLSTTELQGKVMDTCLQFFGGYGYMTEFPIARAYTDARVQRIYGGTSEIMKELVARSLVGK